MKRTFTEVGKRNGYEQEEIEQAIKNVEWEDFRKTDLPFCQGEALKSVISQCNIPLSKIVKMSLHGVIKNTHGFYALEVNYSNGKAYIYIADNGCEICIVASDFISNEKVKVV